MGVAKKYRGKYAKCLANYVKDRLDGRDDLDDCIIYISENYDWNPSSDGVRFLMELLERKLS